MSTITEQVQDSILTVWVQALEAAALEYTDAHNDELEDKATAFTVERYTSLGYDRMDIVNACAPRRSEA